MADEKDIFWYNDQLDKLDMGDKRKAWCEIFNEMIVHTRGEKPAELLETRRPNEDPEVQEYRLKIYQPITKAAINRNIKRLHRIFSSANYTFDLPESLREFIEETKFEIEGKTTAFIDFIYKHVIKRMIEDPNGLLIWLPDGEGLTDAQERVEVRPEIIESKYILWIDEDIVIWADKETDLSRVNSVRKYYGTYYSLTKNSYYKHTKNKDSKTYELTEIYPHNIGEIPAIILGGEADEDGIYHSFFEPFIPFGNDSIRQYSDWQAVMTTSGFPYRTEEFTECDYPQCGGRGWWEEPCDDCENPEMVTCPICHGTGHKPHTSPYGVFIRKETGPGETPSANPMVEFTSPATDIIEVSKTSWEDLLKQARAAIFDDNIEEAQSGVAKIIDREDYYAFLTEISDNVFDNLIKNSLKYIYAYIDISGTDEIEVNKPTSFIVKTENDLVDELGTLIEKKAPLPFIVEVVKDISKRRFGNNESIRQVIEFISKYNPLFAMPAETVNLLVATGIIDDDIAKRSYLAYQGLNELLEKYPELFDKKYEDIKTLLDEWIETTQPSTPRQVRPNGEEE
jgi:hypothetical protein